MLGAVFIVTLLIIYNHFLCSEELQDVLSKKSSNAHEINDAHMKLIQDKGTCKTFGWSDNTKFVIE